MLSTSQPPCFAFLIIPSPSKSTGRSHHFLAIFLDLGSALHIFCFTTNLHSICKNLMRQLRLSLCFYPCSSRFQFPHLSVLNLWENNKIDIHRIHSKIIKTSWELRHKTTFLCVCPCSSPFSCCKFLCSLIKTTSSFTQMSLILPFFLTLKAILQHHFSLSTHSPLSLTHTHTVCTIPKFIP